MKTAKEYEVESREAMTAFMAEYSVFSVSMVQRRLMWGYNRSHRTIEALLAEGVIEIIQDTSQYRVKA